MASNYEELTEQQVVVLPYRETCTFTVSIWSKICVKCVLFVQKNKIKSSIIIIKGRVKTEATCV